MNNKQSFEEVVRHRYSPRVFQPNPLTEKQIMSVLEDAQLTPSNCNTQPWNVHIVSGDKLAELRDAMIAADDSGVADPDFTFDYGHFYGKYTERVQEQAREYYSALGVSRDDKEKRREVYLRNYRFFNAPHAAFLFMPSFGDDVRVGGDIGMYAQTFLLSLAAKGFQGIPQTLLGFHANLTRELLGVSSDYKLMFGISFGYPDDDNTANIRIGRVPVEESVTFHN